MTDIVDRLADTCRNVTCSCMWCTAKAEIARLRAENDALRKDAERCEGLLRSIEYRLNGDGSVVSRAVIDDISAYFTDADKRPPAKDCHICHHNPEMSEFCSACGPDCAECARRKRPPGDPTKTLCPRCENSIARCDCMRPPGAEG